MTSSPYEDVWELFGDGLSLEAIAKRAGLPLTAVERIVRPDDLAEYRSRTNGPITIEHEFRFADGRVFVADGSALDWARASQIGINADRRRGVYPSTHPEFGSVRNTVASSDDVDDDDE